MARKYCFEITGGKEDFFVRVTKEAEEHGVHLKGSLKAGEVNKYGAKATWELSGQVLVVTIHRIPILISWGLVEGKIDEYAPNYGARRIDCGNLK